jgi:hypothetical protein
MGKGARKFSQPLDLSEKALQPSMSELGTEAVQQP